MDKMNQLIGYPGVLDDAVLPARDYPLCPQEQFSRKPGNESTTDQALSVKIPGCCPRFFFFFKSGYMDLEIKTSIKKVANVQPSCLNAWSINTEFTIPWAGARLSRLIWDGK